MDYHKDDRWLFGPDNTSNKTEGWSMVVWLICLIVASAFLGCDGQAAENTAKAELDAHQQYLDTWVRFHSTTTPIRASDLGMVATACHQLQDRTWECYAK